MSKIEQMIERIRERAKADGETARASTENLATLNAALIHENGTSVTNEIVKAMKSKVTGAIKDGQSGQEPPGGNQ